MRIKTDGSVSMFNICQRSHNCVKQLVFLIKLVIVSMFVVSLALHHHAFSQLFQWGCFECMKKRQYFRFYLDGGWCDSISSNGHSVDLLTQPFNESFMPITMDRQRITSLSGESSFFSSRLVHIRTIITCLANLSSNQIQWLAAIT